MHPSTKRSFTKTLELIQSSKKTTYPSLFSTFELQSFTQQFLISSQRVLLQQLVKTINGFPGIIFISTREILFYCSRLFPSRNCDVLTNTDRWDRALRRSLNEYYFQIIRSNHLDEMVTKYLKGNLEETEQIYSDSDYNIPDSVKLNEQKFEYQRIKFFARYSDMRSPEDCMLPVDICIRNDLFTLQGDPVYIKSKNVYNLNEQINWFLSDKLNVELNTFRRSLQECNYSLDKLTEKNIGAIVSFRAKIISLNEKMCKLKIGVYRCTVCNRKQFQKITQDMSTYKPLEFCKSCGEKGKELKAKLVFMVNESIFSSSQTGMLNSANSISESKQFQIERFKNFNLKKNKQYYFEAILLVDLSRPKSYEDLHRLFFSKKFKVISFKETSTDPSPYQQNNYQSLVKEIAYEKEIFYLASTYFQDNIAGNEDIKKMLMLSFVGGASKDSHIHLALFGNPALGKSTLIKFLASLQENGHYINATGTTQAGLGMTKTTDPETGKQQYHPGVLIQSNLLAIDEIDKAKIHDIQILSEILGLQQFTQMNSHLKATWKTNTTIISAGNFAYDNYNLQLDLEHNINNFNNFFIKFDMILILKDRRDKESDYQLALRVGKNFQFQSTKLVITESEEEDLQQNYDEPKYIRLNNQIFQNPNYKSPFQRKKEFLEKKKFYSSKFLIIKSYLKFCKKRSVKPVSESIKSLITTFFVSLRGQYMHITLNFPKTLLKLVQARAKLRTKGVDLDAPAEVTVQDFLEIKKLVKNCLHLIKKTSMSDSEFIHQLIFHKEIQSFEQIKSKCKAHEINDQTLIDFLEEKIKADLIQIKSQSILIKSPNRQKQRMMYNLKKIFEQKN